VTRNIGLQETNLLRQVQRSVRNALPADWGAVAEAPNATAPGTLRITSATGQEAGFVIIPKATADLRDVSAYSRERLGCFVQVAPYFSAPARDRLTAAGISYVDATGWVRLVCDDPMIAITGQGAPRAPRPSRRAVTTRLDGPAAARVIRELLGTVEPVGVRTLADRAGASPGTVSKLLPTLMADGAIQRDASGKVIEVNRRQLLNRWSLDYQALRSNGAAGWFVAPRGLDNALTKLRDTPGVAVSGSQGAKAYLPDGVAGVLPVTQLFVYAADPELVADAAGLVPVEPSAANVIVVQARDETVLNDGRAVDGVRAAPLGTVLADLLTLPGRYPSQAEALMDALAKEDARWETQT
jgi:hypothetical protein